MIEKIKNLLNLFNEPVDKYSNDFYLNSVIKVNFLEFEQAEECFFKNKQKYYSNYIRTAFNLAVSIDNLRAWENISDEYEKLHIIKNIANAIKHKKLKDTEKNKYFLSLDNLNVNKKFIYGGAIDRNSQDILRITCEIEKNKNGKIQELRDFKWLAEKAIQELSNYLSSKNRSLND